MFFSSQDNSITAFCPQDKLQTETFLNLAHVEFPILIFCFLLLYCVFSQTISNFLSIFMPLRFLNTAHSVELLLSSFCLMHYFILPNTAQIYCVLLVICLFPGRIDPSAERQRISIALCPNFYFGTEYISNNNFFMLNMAQGGNTVSFILVPSKHIRVSGLWKVSQNTC